MKAPIHFTILLLVVVLILSSGCITTPTPINFPERTIRAITTGTGINMSYDVIMGLNFSEISSKLTNRSFGCENTTNIIPTPDGGAYDLSYWVYLPQNKTARGDTTFNVIFSAWHDNNSKYGNLDISYWPFSNASQLEQEKQYLKDKANEVAQICNLTLNWEGVKFVVSYSD